MKVVLDTNIAVSASINPKGPPADIIRAWRAQIFTWVTSQPLLDELQRTLLSPRVRPYQASTEPELSEFLFQVNQSTDLVSPTQTLEVIKNDPADNRVLEAALAAKADYIVSGDKDLLGLGSFENIPIITPTRFNAILAASR
jgi:putative PIN family toxin of toxin-antitoxin system